MRSYVVGLVGESLSGTLAHRLVEGCAQRAGVPLAYRVIDTEALNLDPHDLKRVVRWLVRLGYDGFSVTHPYKQQIIDLLDELTPTASDLGAVNTVTVREGRLVGDNTDWRGFASHLAAAAPDVRDDRVLLLGAGGAGVAVAYGLLRDSSAHVTVADVDPRKAGDVVTRMAALFGADRVALSRDTALAIQTCQGLVNATPRGMTAHPGVPIAPSLVRPDMWVADIVYLPRRTELLEICAARGSRTIPGAGMAAYTAAHTFEVFTGVSPDLKDLRAHLDQLLAPGF